MAVEKNFLLAIRFLSVSFIPPTLHDHILFTQSKSKGKAHPIAGHEGPEVE
jgi:hypothetical protein